MVVVLLFYFLALITVVGAVIVAFSKNIVHSAFGLMASMVGVAGLYGYMSADFLAIVQLIVYVGGIIVLILFAVMFTGDIRDVKASNKTVNLLWTIPFVAAIIGVIIGAEEKVKFVSKTTNLNNVPTTRMIGDALLSKYVLPFEVISVLLLAVLLGAVHVARKFKTDNR
jgi:NADH-quinone oxidoreductase subunit J